MTSERTQGPGGSTRAARATARGIPHRPGRWTDAEKSAVYQDWLKRHGPLPQPQSLEPPTAGTSADHSASFSLTIGGNQGDTTWKEWTAYTAGQTVTYAGVTYRCLPRRPAGSRRTSRRCGSASASPGPSENP
ncbi:carbohydrate-binding protein [Sphaerisporangium sp. NPDC051017]|uniref:carbohydrate-binding protein n=1 Tax=Sphaerisporangium sp. NPDC051017 TaxID=3154636 RepID=UPI003437D59A